MTVQKENCDGLPQKCDKTPVKEEKQLKDCKSMKFNNLSPALKKRNVIENVEYAKFKWSDDRLSGILSALTLFIFCFSSKLKINFSAQN